MNTNPHQQPAQPRQLAIPGQPQQAAYQPQHGAEQNIYAAPQGLGAFNPNSQQQHIPLTLKQKLFSFRGRISRAGYWGYSLLTIGIFYGAIIIAVGLLGATQSMTAMATGDSAAITENVTATPGDSVLGLVLLAFTAILYILIIWTSLAISVKRWHDRGKSGAMVLVNLIPFVGGIWTLIECGCLPGDMGRNHYGHDPLMASGKTHNPTNY